MHLPDQGGFFFIPPSLESFKSPYEALSSSYSRTELIPLNLTGGSLQLGEDQRLRLELQLPAPFDWPLLTPKGSNQSHS